ncbi:protein ANTAGONIST OF LIKE HETEROCHROMATIN PROTEIN 1-like [Centruroides sculpturatus]|uniref:protein ANTAGONIST OF LIKE HETEROCHROMATIN PROTEIN 1-like n=1 Tax=Centruroides sculpturatus TaxID=218467 RepID=UPI000C6EE3A5|nr:protein ANTAGONIST OF LIKE HETEROCHROMATIN PROTEIN 1-like [Centruroides sculpturatus]
MGDSEDKTTYAVCAIIVAELEKQNENKRRRKRGPTKTWIKRRKDKGAFLNLNLELRGEDPTSYRRWLRLTKSQFEHLLNEISPRIQKQDTNFGKPISPAERLTVTLRFLATGSTFRDLSWEFRIGARTISYIVTETCAALYETLKYTFQVPTSKEHWMAIAKHFQDRWNVPHCLGAIDGKHIVMRKPINSGSHYHNYKGTESIVLLAVVDANYTFRYVDVGTQGRISDGGVWNKCNLKELIDVNALDIPPAHPLPGQDIVTPYVFLADDAFGLKPYILKPYGGSDLTLEERICNYRRESRVKISWQQEGESVMILGGFGWGGKTDLVFVDENMNSEKYQELLYNNMITFGALIADHKWKFQQANAPIHASMQTKYSFKKENIDVIDWPSRFDC